MLVEFNTDLKINDRSLSDNNRNDIINGLSDQQKKWENGGWAVSQTLFPVEDNLTEGVYHMNYLCYLELCWASHYGVILTPDIMWYSLLCELATIISKDVEKFRHLFSESADKQEIFVGDGTSPVLPLHEVMGHLRKLIPSNLAEIFLADFTTSTPREISARYAAFADAMSPYYNYSMFCCGISKLYLRGTQEDWISIRTRWSAANDAGLTNSLYHDRVDTILMNIINHYDTPNPEFLKNIFSAEKCGSGSQQYALGWWTDLFTEKIKEFTTNYPTHISTVKYKDLPRNKDFEMKQGLLSSQIVDDFLEPSFSRIVYEKRS